jgi:hypothetical protein
MATKAAKQVKISQSLFSRLSEETATSTANRSPKTSGPAMTGRASTIASKQKKFCSLTLKAKSGA